VSGELFRTGKSGLQTGCSGGEADRSCEIPHESRYPEGN